MRWILAVALTACLCTNSLALDVYQNLDEATARIPRLANRPYEKLIDDNDFYQSETLIFTDQTTGREIWSLSMELCVDMANVERRMVFSCDGSVFSMKGNKAWKKLDGSIYHTSWSGYNYLMNADLTNRRKLWVNVGGVQQTITNKFDTWDRRQPRTLYYTVNDKLYRVTVGSGAFDNTGEVIYTFPNANGKFIQTINDDNILCIQDDNGDVPADNPLFYVIDLNKAPSDPGFCRYHGMHYGITGVAGHDPDNEYHVHVIGVGRGSDRVSWNYGPMTSVGESVHFSVPIDNLDATPEWIDASNDPYGQYMSHPGTGLDGRKAYFAGPTTPPSSPQGWGLWVRLPGMAPVYTNKAAAGGHATWCGKDPEWYFANITRRDPPWSELDGKIVAGNSDGSQLMMLCDPYDRHRGGGDPWAGIPRPNQSPDATKCWFHSSMLMPVDDYVGSYIVVFRRPYAPISLGWDGQQISYTPHAVSNEVRSYLLYRLVGDRWQFVQALPAAAGACTPPADGTYMMTALEWSGLESYTSSPTITVPEGTTGDPVTGWDTQAPSPPTGLAAVNEAAGQYRLTWTGPPDQDVRYYNLYFSSDGHPAIEQARRFASPPKTCTEYLDWTAPTSGEAYYAVTAVDRQGNESMPARWPAPTYHTLTVNSGSGGGSYFAGWVAEIHADAPAAGQAFDQWTGNVAAVTDPHAADTTVVMPDQDATVTATYSASFTLTINNGTGGGNYPSGHVAAISADEPAAGMMFFRWAGDTAGDTAGVADTSAANTTVTMPADDVELTATYVTIPGRTLLVDFGASAEQNAFGLAGWNSIWLGNYTSYSDQGPAGIMGGWTGQWHCQQVSGPARDFLEGDEIVVTWYNTGSTVTWTPKVSFDDSDHYNSGADGTWYDMTETTVPAGQSAASHFVVTAAAAGQYSLVNVCRVENGTNQLLCDKIELLTTPQPGDLDGDGFVGQGDLDIVLDQWGHGGPPHEAILDQRADPSGDGFVGQDDLDVVLDNWGATSP